jgi:hypothetical protein
MRRSDAEPENLAPNTPTVYGARRRARTIAGIWTRCSSSSVDTNFGFGVPSIKKGLFSMLSSNPSQHQGSPAPADPAYEEAGLSAEAHRTDTVRMARPSGRSCPLSSVDPHKGLNNRAENSHLPLRKRERIMQRFRSPGALRHFARVFSAIRNLFAPPRSKGTAIAVHPHRLRAIAHWRARSRLLPEPGAAR